MTAVTIDAADGLALTVPRLLRARAEALGDAPFLVCDDDVLTYAAADQRSARLARGLLAGGAGLGSPVGVLHPNGSAFAVAWLAAARIGAITVPLSTFSTSHELGELLRRADVRVLLSASEYRSHDFVAALSAAVPELDLAAPPPLYAPSTPALRHIAFSQLPGTPGTLGAGGTDGAAGWTVDALERAGDDVDPAALRSAEDAVTPADRMVMVHTSGSTSEPKGVLHGHGSLIRHIDNLNQLRSYTPDEVLFSNSPFFWIGGFAYSLLGTLVAGARLVCSNALAASDMLDVLERERPTLVNGFAQPVAHLPADPSFARRDLSSIRRGNLYPIMPASVCPRDPELHHAMLGMTEAGSVCLVSADETEQPEHRRGSFGMPAPGLEARVVDPDLGTVCGPGVLGELHLRGPFMMEGYHGHERHEVFDADGWYATGDLVVVDDDGFFYFKGRQGEMIKTGGANVSPREVEAAIADVAGLRSHVVGIDDERRGQLVAAAIIVGSEDPVDVDADELRARLGERLSVYKVPRRIRVLGESEVPMMSSGKIDLRALRELLQ